MKNAPKDDSISTLHCHEQYAYHNKITSKIHKLSIQSLENRNASFGFLGGANREGQQRDRKSKRIDARPLHKLDLEKGILLQIEEQDTDKCVLAMGWLKSVAKIKEKRAMEAAVMAIEEPTEQFPIGNAPAWEEILLTMARNLTLLMSEWVWEERWDTRSTAGRLFLQFTID